MEVSESEYKRIHEYYEGIEILSICTAGKRKHPGWNCRGCGSTFTMMDVPPSPCPNCGEGRWKDE